MKLQHTDLLNRAFVLPWRARTLWILGALTVSLASGWNLFGNGFTVLGQGGAPFFFSAPPPRDLPSPEALLSLLLILACLYSLGAVAFWILTYVARAGLIRAAVAADAGEAVSWRQGLAWGWSRWAWHHFLQNLIVGLLLSVPFFLLLLPPLAIPFLFGAREESFVLSFGGFLCLGFPLLLLMIPVGFVVAAWVHLARRAVVLEDLGPWQGLKRGWQLLRENPGDVAFLFLLDMAVAMGWAMGALIVDLLLLAILVGPAVVLYLLTGRLIPSLLLGGVGLLLAWPLDAAVQGYRLAFSETFWTLGYRELTAELQGAGTT